MLSQNPKLHWILEDSQASPVSPAGKSSVYVQMRMEHKRNDTGRGKSMYG